MSHTSSIVFFSLTEVVYFVSMRPSYAASILKLYGKVKLILSSKTPFAILLSYFIIFLSYKTHRCMSHAKKHFPTDLSVSNAMLLNNLIHQVLVLVLQHPRSLSLNLLLCVWTNSQNVKHLLQWITGTSWHFGKKHRRFPMVPKALMRSSLFARSWFRHPGSSSSQHRSSLFCQYSPSSPTLGASTCGLVFGLVFAWVGCCHFWFILKLKPLLRNTILWSKKYKCHIFYNAGTQYGMKNYEN